VNPPASTRGDSGFWRSDRIAALFLFALAAGVFWQCRRLPLGSLAEPGPAAWPALLAVLLAALAAAIFAGGRTSPAISRVAWSEGRHAAALLVAAGFAAAMLETLGFRLTVLAVLLFLIGVVERRRALPTVAVSVGLSFGTHLVFAQWLRVPLPIGLFGL
jgi:hypothetical protein